MATYTSNLSLKKPAQSDKIRIADLNGNADNIDAAIGADFGQSSKPSINAAINSLADGLAIVAQGDVHAAISSGQFVYVRNHGTLAEGLYVASAAISANAALSGTNLTADTSGGLNALNSNKLPATSYSTYDPVTLGNYTAVNNGFLMIQTWVNASKTFSVKVGNTKLFEHFAGSAMNATAQIPVKAGTTLSITTDDSISSSSEIGKFVAT